MEKSLSVVSIKGFYGRVVKSFMSVLWFFMVLGSDFYLLLSDKTLKIQQKITFVLRLMHVCGPKRKESTKSINH